MNLTDTHTHNPEAGPEAIINIEPDALPLPAAGRFSTGVHPWRSAEAAKLWPMVETVAADKRIVAIGECGIDRLRGADIKLQEELFMRHARLAERVGKPLIIHCVKAWGELLGAYSDIKPSQPWIIHGFRCGPALAHQLLNAGMHISLGEHFNRATAAIIPDDRLHIETDCSTLPIGYIAESVRQARKPHTD